MVRCCQIIGRSPELVVVCDRLIQQCSAIALEEYPLELKAHRYIELYRQGATKLEGGSPELGMECDRQLEPAELSSAILHEALECNTVNLLSKER